MFILSLFLLGSTIVYGSFFNPADKYITKNYCGTECCQFGKWHLDRTTTAFSKPYGRKLMDLPAGINVNVITGENHAVPVGILIVADHNQYHKNERIYLLALESEGLVKVWQDGKEIEDAELAEIHGFLEGQTGCAKKPSAKCWADVHGTLQAEWWLQVELPGGGSGWVLGGTQFSGYTKC